MTAMHHQHRQRPAAAEVASRKQSSAPIGTVLCTSALHKGPAARAAPRDLSTGGSDLIFIMMCAHISRY